MFPEAVVRSDDDEGSQMNRSPVGQAAEISLLMKRRHDDGWFRMQNTIRWAITHSQHKSVL